MTMPFYVAPEQVMKDRAEYAQKGIARGRSLVATIYADGVLIVAENPSRSLHKISEIYDRIAFAGVGKYNEYDQLRVAGVRHADTKGFAFSREDVDARSLANLYAQFLGNVFTHEMKPLEVEILVAELGADGRPGPAVPHRLRGHHHRRGPLRRAGRRRRATIAERVAAAWRADLGPAPPPSAWPSPPWPAPSGRWAPATSRWPCSAGSNGRRSFRRIADDELAGLLAPPTGRARASRRRSAAGRPGCGGQCHHRRRGRRRRRRRPGGRRGPLTPAL